MFDCFEADENGVTPDCSGMGNWVADFNWYELGRSAANYEPAVLEQYLDGTDLLEGFTTKGVYVVMFTNIGEAHMCQHGWSDLQATAEFLMPKEVAGARN